MEISGQPVGLVSNSRRRCLDKIPIEAGGPAVFSAWTVSWSEMIFRLRVHLLDIVRFGLHGQLILHAGVIVPSQPGMPFIVAFYLTKNGLHGLAIHNNVCDGIVKKPV